MILDTNILIAYFNDQVDIADAIERWQRDSKLLLISTITQTEVLSYARLAPQQIKLIQQFLTSFIIVPYDVNLANIGAYFRREYHLTLPDAAIAATALYSDSPLVTRDKAFSKVSELTLVSV